MLTEIYDRLRRRMKIRRLSEKSGCWCACNNCMNRGFHCNVPPCFGG